jgi:hypothetical protein
MAGMNRFFRVLPRGPVEAFARAIKADTSLMQAAHSPERAAYEKRVSGS